MHYTKVFKEVVTEHVIRSSVVRGMACPHIAAGTGDSQRVSIAEWVAQIDAQLGTELLQVWIDICF
jgi:hypothetical protein